MPTQYDRTLRALRVLLRSSHLAEPDELPDMVALAGAEFGAIATAYVCDYDQLVLVPLLSRRMEAKEQLEPIPIDGTLAGRAFTDTTLQLSTAAPPTMWLPVLNGTERLGVLQLSFAGDIAADDDFRMACVDLASMVAELILTRSLYGDFVERARRSIPMTLPAELQWRLLPPLTFVSPRVAVTGVLAPTAEVAGDSFDYALNGDTLHVAIFDAMGHGLEATLLASVAMAALRNARRSDLDLRATVGVIDAELASQFGPDKFVTGIVGQLDVTSGWWRWANCGHHPALVVRRGRVVKLLEAPTGTPLALGLMTRERAIHIGEERLERGDRLLLYTDGVIEARDAAGAFFGTERLVAFVSTQAAAGRPAAETMRRLNQAILQHQEGALQDDATTVMVEWLTNEAQKSGPHI